MYLQAKNQLHPLHLSWDIAKDIGNLLFWVIWPCLNKRTQNVDINVENFNVYLLGKKSTSSTFFFLKIMSRLCQLAIVEFRIRCDVICNKSDSVILEKQPSELARNCQHYSQTSYKTWGCNLWISHEEKVIMWNLHMRNLLIWRMSIRCLQVSEE